MLQPRERVDGGLDIHATVAVGGGAGLFSEADSCTADAVVSHFHKLHLFRQSQKPASAVWHRQRLCLGSRTTNRNVYNHALPARRFCAGYARDRLRTRQTNACL